MKFIAVLALLPFFLIPLLAHTQSNEIDSVLKHIEPFPPKKQIKILEDSAWANMYRSYSKAFSYSSEANKIAKDNNDENRIAETLNTMGIVKRKQAKYEESYQYLNEAYEIWLAKKDSVNLSRVYNGLANLTRAMGKNEEAEKFAIEGLKIDRLRKDTVRIAGKLTALGNIFKAQGRYESAMNYYMEASRLDEAIGDSAMIAIDWSSIADMFFQIENHEQAIYYYNKSLGYQGSLDDKLGQEINHNNIAGAFKELEIIDSALIHYDKALILAEQIGDDIGIAEVNVNLGALFAGQNELTKSQNHYQKSLDQANEMNDKWYQASAHNGLGHVLVRLNNLTGGIEHLEKANKLASELSFSTVLIDSYQKLAEAYHKKKNDQQAYKYLSQYLQLNDSTNSVVTKTRIAELETKYETEKKEQKIELLNKEKELQSATIKGNNISIIALILFILTLLIVAFWLYKRVKYKQQVAIEKERAKLKDEQVRAIINSQEKERKRFAMDLHDDFGQLLSAMRLSVHSISEKAPETVGELTKKSEGLIDNMYNSLKNIAFDLMPQTLMEKGLEEALEELQDQINGTDTLAMSVQSYGIKDKIQPDEKIALYRIIQEFISNIIKYSDATKINISITDHEDGLSLMIEDNGTGYDLNDFLQGKGNGWKNIHSRLDLLGATVEFDIVKGRKNTTVSIEVPYHTKEKSMAA